MFFLGSWKLSSKIDAMRSAEDRLMDFAKQFGNRKPEEYEMRLIDTEIPGSVVPLDGNSSNTNEDGDKQFLTIHGVVVESKHNCNGDSLEATRTTNTPLVLLHGYANGGLYFYRNLIGISRYFSTVYSLDWLGWGLSSRPDFARLTDTSTETAEQFFVESLEAWRKANDVPKMILAGHSMGGYMSVAYCEKYPERVERLILLSPAGVPEETPEFLEQREAFRQRTTSSFRGKTLMAILPSLFDYGYTPCSVLRTVPESTGMGWVQGYVQRRLRDINEESEQNAIGDYLYHNATLPGSAEYALNRVLRMDVMARKPLVHRIPHLKVPQVTFLYGADDWMDSSGGLAAERACQQVPTAPNASVYEVPNAGHLLMLDNWAAVNAGIIIGGLGIEHSQAALVLDKEDAEVIPRKLFAGTRLPSPTQDMVSAGSPPAEESIQQVSVKA
jgi:cardiolipin-specific phospholipase